ncbi:hypothetical protein VTN49DRAFT_3451 [Thermomyces lanuginosus]|uniref:uncharacterized protein n=1 Tax=Thermomyces lanuginosus TaxID=5541 RepID=UPI0037445164
MPLVEVLATSKANAAPGWTYVTETADPRPPPAATATATTGRKRAIREPAHRATDLTSREQHAINRHLAELDRENHRENVVIPVPQRKDAIQREYSGKPPRAKTTTNVRRVLTSQKTFRNHLDDFEALNQQQQQQQQQHQVSGAGTSTTATPTAQGSSTSKKRSRAAATTPDKVESPAPVPSTTSQQKPSSESQQAEPVVSTNQALLKTPYDNDPLLKSYVPRPPSDRLMQILLSEPPLTYTAARAGPSSLPSARRSQRYFCVLCGYWGKIRCRNCGARTCGLACYKVHEDSRCGAFF